MDDRHIPVLYRETIDALRPRDGGRYIDCTLGAGGHAAGLLEAAGSQARLLGLDADPGALEVAREKLSRFGDRVVLANANFSRLAEVARKHGFAEVDGVVMDLGISSMQLDLSERGFSFQREAPLDMRFDPTQPVTAADIVNDASEEELRRILYEYGEERNAPRIARAIVSRRASKRLETTEDLAVSIRRVVGPHRGGLNPLTRTFQALRIAVNRELDSLRDALPQVVDVLDRGGCMAVISFHSLEDRIVKEFTRRESALCVCPPGLPVCVCGQQPTLKLVNRKPIIPSEEEMRRNPRARSAKLRVAEKIV
jgi:16S rRNA (cytosine1402-N4)-methyltransferase